MAIRDTISTMTEMKKNALKGWLVAIRVDGEAEFFEFPTQEAMDGFIKDVKERMPDVEYIFTPTGGD